MASDALITSTLHHLATQNLRAQYLASAASMLQPSATQLAGQAAANPGFAGVLAQALQNTSRLQHESTRITRAFQASDPEVSLEDTMIAMQKASLSFQMAVQVRNRLVTAYQDIMNMPA